MDWLIEKLTAAREELLHGLLPSIREKLIGLIKNSEPEAC